ncbi:MAG: DUF4340 domain-containing protein [Rudaea sp.]
MNPKTLRMLAVAALVALIAAFWVSRRNAPESDEHERSNATLLPHLRDEANDVTAIRIIGAADKPQVTLTRAADGWIVAERAGYPADIAKLREYVLKLADATVIEAKTANPARYAELGVEDTTAAQAKSVLITLSGTKDPVNLLVGAFNGGGGGGTFVRRAGEAQSLLVKGNLLAEKDPAAWIRRDLTHVDAERIKQVSITAPDGKTLHIGKSTTADTNFMIADVPKGREPASDYVANGLGSGLSHLRIDDVAAAKDLPPPEKPFKVHYVAFGGLALDVTAWDAGGRNAVQFVASNDGAQLDADISAGQAKAKAAYDTEVATAKLKVVEKKGDDAAIAQAEADVAKPPSMLDPAHDAAQRRGAAAKVVEDLNRTFAGWTFIVPAYEFANYNKGIEELLKPSPDKTGAAPALKLPLPGTTSSLTTPAQPTQGQ